ncbi:TonB-dependent receptor [Flavitalea flava]
MVFIWRGKYPLNPFLLVIGMLMLSTIPAFAQQQVFTIHFSKGSLEQALTQLRRETNISIAFTKEDILGEVIPAVVCEQQTVGQILQVLLKGLSFNAEQLGTGWVIRKLVHPKEGAPVAAPVRVRPSGKIKGRIVDFDSFQPLQGATVTLQETGQSVLSDEKGFYSFKGVPDGTYTLVVTYTGYQKNWIAGIVAGAGNEVATDFKMQAGNSLGEVVVQAGARKVKAVTHTTEKELIAEIRGSTGILSGISSEQIAKTADRNAADVVKRIPGITVMDNRLIVVRGMNERYNLTYLNDNIAPSTELNTKAFAYDLLPGSIIDRIIVYKSPRADLNGEFAGAAVKIYTRNAMPVKHFDIGIQLAHRPGSTMTDVNTYNGGKRDWLGIDDGTRKLPGFSPGYFQSGKSAGNISQADMVNSFSPTLTYRRITSTPDMQFFANYYNVFRLGKRIRLFDLTSVTYTRETTSYELYRQTGNTDIYKAEIGVGVGGTGLDVGVKNKVINSSQTTSIGKINLLENLTLRLNPKNTIQFKNFLVNDGRQFTGVNDSRFNALPRYNNQKGGSKDIILSFQQRLLYSGNLGGRHEWGANHHQELDWNLGYSHDLQSIPDQRISHFAYVGVNNYEIPGLNYLPVGSNSSEATFGMISRLFTRQIENNYNGSLDYRYTLNASFHFSLGTSQLFKTREVGRRFFRVNRAGLAPDETFDTNLGTGGGSNDGWNQGYGWINPSLIYYHLQDLGRIWNPANFPSDKSGLAIYDVTSPVDKYVASEQNNSFYGMGDWQSRDKRFFINGGVRVEYDRQKISGAQIKNDQLRVVYAVHPKTSVLPSLNLTWRPDSLFVARMSYGRTVNRPEFRELTPYIDIDYINNEKINGNPTMVSATIDNYDFRLELYPRSVARNEIIDVGLFYKNLQKPIERIRMDFDADAGAGPFTLIFFDNAPSAKLYGLEAEIKKNLSFLGGAFFRRLNIVLNGSWTKSTTQQYDNSLFGRVNKDNIVKGRPLQGQAPYVLNGGLFYEHPGIGSKIGLTYNVTGPVIYAKSLYNKFAPSQRMDTTSQNSVRPDLLQLPMHLLDFSYSQRIIRSLQAKLSIQNLLDQPYRIVEDQNYNQRYDAERPLYNSRGDRYYKGDNFYTKYKPGRYFLLSFSYAF